MENVYKNYDVPANKPVELNRSMTNSNNITITSDSTNAKDGRTEKYVSSIRLTPSLMTRYDTKRNMSNITAHILSSQFGHSISFTSPPS